MRNIWEMVFANNHADLNPCLRTKRILLFVDADSESGSPLGCRCGLGPQCLWPSHQPLLYGHSYQPGGHIQQQDGLCRQIVPIPALILSRTCQRLAQHIGWMIRWLDGWMSRRANVYSCMSGRKERYIKWIGDWMNRCVDGQTDQ